MRKKTIIVISILMVGMVFGQTKIRFATVAPEGSTWMKVMREYTKAVEDATNNEIKFKVYPGQVAGDEKDVLRKIRIGQLDSGGFTGVVGRNFTGSPDYGLALFV
jgi:TRAP-type C4-dicarboxylate transport system substrate-binding protein